MFHNDSFCGELWSQIEINTLGDYKICCLANYDDDYGLAIDTNGNVMNVLTHSIEEAINSVTHKEHRLQLKENIKVSRCRNCYDQEYSSNLNDPSTDWGQSKRQRVNFITAKDIKEYVSVDTADKFTLNDGTSTAKIVNLGLRLGNVCNQKCIMCSPEYSNQWYDDWVNLYGYDKTVLFSEKTKKQYFIEKDSHGRNRIDFPKWWDTDIWWERFDSIAPSLRHIYFSGGEPLVSSALDKILSKLIENGYSKNIILRFDTNLSVINSKIIDKFSNFKRIDFCVSLDEIDKRYELIRFPGKYSTLIENIKTVKSKNMSINYLSSCVGISSIYSMIRITELSETLSIPVTFRFLEAPSWLDLRNLPKSAKQEIIDTYNSLNHSEHSSRHYDSIKRFLEKYIEYENLNAINQFVINMDKLDVSRNTNWRETLPDVYSLLVKHCGIK
jgi:MoaA/NifB/PqqE/SkfB family radical SAM enzyme